MAKLRIKHNSQTQQVFEDLDKYRNFCREYGYRFDERDLYNNKSYVYRQSQKFAAGKAVKNQWELDAEKFKEQQLLRSNR
jgi:hypothetical protein